MATTHARWLLVLCAAWTAATAAPNVVPNAGFEQGADEAPDGWRFYSWRECTGWWEKGAAHSGQHSLGLRGLNGGWNADIPVEPGAVYGVKFFYRARGERSRVLLFVRVLGDRSHTRSLLYKALPAVTGEVREGFVAGQYVGGADAAGWVELQGGDFRVPEGVREVNILIKLMGGGAASTLWLDDVSVSRRRTRKPTSLARVLLRLDDGVVWTLSENEKWLPNAPPPAGVAENGIQVSAARGEWESFQIVVAPERDWRQCRWRWTDFTGPSPFPASSLRCRLVETVDIVRPEGPYGHRGLNPDPLTDRLPRDLAAGRSQAFWFTLRVPANQAPGRYSGSLILQADGVVKCRVPVQLRVRSFELPARHTLDVRSAFRSNLVLARERGDREQVLRRYYRDIYEHGSRCTPGALPRVRVRGQQVAVDAAELVAHLQFMRDELGARRFDLPVLWISHRNTHRIPVDAEWQGLRIFAADQLTRLTPQFTTAFTAYLREFVAQLERGGVFEAVRVRFTDEPNLDDEPTVNGILTLARFLHRLEPRLTLALTATHPHPALIDVIRIWVLHTDSWSRHVLQIEQARKAGCRIYVYNNGVNFPEHNPLRVRLWPWLLFKYGVDGTYSWWGTCCWRGELENPWQAGQGSSGVLLYPPRSAEEQGPIDSIRWELFREGLEDYEYLHMAAQLADRLVAAGRADAAAQLGRAVNAALTLVERWPAVKPANDEPYTLDVVAVRAARERLAEAIERAKTTSANPQTE